ncbi:uncharacterized protein H6S33_008222 [Morchella sextelata]|uniref:uncharacterized protein n=1 Tax=Morchella sextelata TaxID=1174677 RepID=UPI001D03747E|nr:uncharacterized protein H6S33_008222 [Morchella sextelata]KAH0603218.1 hypothetical protein H6S33_008222 [Morchella sextelata]
MSHADPTPEAPSAASAASPDFVPPPAAFLAELQSVTSQETLMLKLQSDKLDCLRTVSSYVDRLLHDFEGSAGNVWAMYSRRLADCERSIRQESAQYDTMTKLVADSRRLRAEMLRSQSEQRQRAEQTVMLKEMDQLRDDVRRGALAEVEALRRQLSEEKRLHEEVRLARDQQSSERTDREKELGKVTLEVERLREDLTEEKKLHEETRLMRDRHISERDEKEKELRKVTWEVLKLQAQLSEEKRLHEEVRLARDQQSSERNDREKELGERTLEVERLREHLTEEKKLHEETRLRRDWFSEQNNKQKEVCEELHKENKALLEEISQGREVREETKSEIEKLRAELLEEREHVREEIKVEMKLQQAEQERSRRALLEQQAKQSRRAEQTTARD